MIDLNLVIGLAADLVSDPATNMTSAVTSAVTTDMMSDTTATTATTATSATGVILVALWVTMKGLMVVGWQSTTVILALKRDFVNASTTLTCFQRLDRSWTRTLTPTIQTCFQRIILLSHPNRQR